MTDLTRRIPWRKADLVGTDLAENNNGRKPLDDKRWGDNGGVGPDYAQILRDRIPTEN